jgi:hypothetical protein
MRRFVELALKKPNESIAECLTSGLTCRTKTIGDLRETTDETFASIPNLGPGSVKWLRAQLSERRQETRIQ